MNTAHFKERLLAEEHALTARLGRAMSNARESADEGAARDIADDSVTDERRSEQFIEAEAESTTLTQVRDALARIEAGTFGACLADGEPIEPKRLEAMPWTSYCLKHQAQLESDNPSKTPTL